AGDADYHYNGMVMETNPFSEGSPNYIVHKLLYDIEYDRLSQQVNLNRTTAMKLLNRGEIACMLVDFEDLAVLQKAGTNPDDIGYMPFPYNIDGKRYATATYSASYGIPRESDNKVTAQAFVDYMIRNSGYCASVGAISLKKKSVKPTLLSDFAGVTLILDNPPTEDKIGKYEELCEKSGVLLEEGEQKKQIIEVAIEARPGEKPQKWENIENQSVVNVTDDGTDEEEMVLKNFDDIMQLWYTRWRKAK
ncbi:MAG: extracellular solute-binding protein, partial [Lachnospiraceae bacterium]